MRRLLQTVQLIQSNQRDVRVAAALDHDNLVIISCAVEKFSQVLARVGIAR